MDKTPNEYIRWRYAGGEDREAIAKDTMKISDAELELQKTVIDFVYTDPDTAKTTKTKRVIKRLTGERKTNKSTKENDYEVQFKAPHDGDDCKHFYGYKKLVKWGWDKACKKVDVKVAQAASGMFRPLTSSNVESHLKNVGLDAEFATHHRISALSGGQKVKVVLGACAASRIGPKSKNEAPTASSHPHESHRWRNLARRPPQPAKPPQVPRCGCNLI